MANSSSNTRRWMEEPRRPREDRPRDDRRTQEERYWRQLDDDRKRQQEAQRRAKEEADKKAADLKSETNYPSLGGPRPKTSGLGKNQFAALTEEKAKPTNVYSTLAKNWKKEDEETRERERLRRLQSERERFSSDGIFVYRPRQVLSGYGGYADPEDEDELTRSKPSDDEWREVSHKTYKPKREKTVEELDEEYERDLEDEQNEGGHNEHLFEVSHRHDHY